MGNHRYRSCHVRHCLVAADCGRTDGDVHSRASRVACGPDSSVEIRVDDASLLRTDVPKSREGDFPFKPTPNYLTTNELVRNVVEGETCSNQPCKTCGMESGS